jgi:glutaredoxin
VPPALVVTLVTRPGCHLCDDARDVVTPIIAEFAGVSLVEKSIDDDDALNLRFAEEIPVVLIGDRVHNIWRVDPARLRAALEEEIQ